MCFYCPTYYLTFLPSLLPRLPRLDNAALSQQQATFTPFHTMPHPVQNNLSNIGSSAALSHRSKARAPLLPPSQATHLADALPVSVPDGATCIALRDLFVHYCCYAQVGAAPLDMLLLHWCRCQCVLDGWASDGGERDKQMKKCACVHKHLFSLFFFFLSSSPLTCTLLRMLDGMGCIITATVALGGGWGRHDEMLHDCTFTPP